MRPLEESLELIKRGAVDLPHTVLWSSLTDPGAVPDSYDVNDLTKEAGEFPLAETVEAMEALVAQGKIRRWGVSNFDTDDMQALWQVPGGRRCATNQVLYHLASRGIEYDLLPWCQQQQLPVMAYSPLAQAGRLRDGLMNHPALNGLAREKGVTVAQLLLAWIISHEGVMAIPKAGSIAHVKENAAALELVLDENDIAVMEQAFPAPGRKTPLDMV